jgi:excisionase family DNA binding protein
VQDELAISASQVYALVRRGDLPAVKLGEREQWRVERAKLEIYSRLAPADAQQRYDQVITRFPV